MDKKTGQPSPYDIWTAGEIVKLIEEARVNKENLKSVFVVNRKIANTAIDRDVSETLSTYPIPTLTTVLLSACFCGDCRAGMGCAEIDNAGLATAEIGAIRKELMQLLKRMERRSKSARDRLPTNLHRPMLTTG